MQLFMFRPSCLLRWHLNPNRKKTIGRQIADFDNITPELLKDVGVHPNKFNDLAKASTDHRLAVRGAEAVDGAAIKEHANNVGMPGDDSLRIGATAVVRPGPG